MHQIQCVITVHVSEKKKRKDFVDVALKFCQSPSLMTGERECRESCNCTSGWQFVAINSSVVVDLC